MTEALLLVSVGSLLLTGAATLAIAALTLNSARGYVKLAEPRMEYLCKEQARLLMILREERQGSKEEGRQTPEQHLEAQRWAEQASQELLPLQQGPLTEELEQERGQRLEGQQERGGRELRTRRDVEHRIDELRRELQELREVQKDREVERNRSSTLSEGPLGDMMGTRELLEKEPLPTEEAQGVRRTPRPASPFQTTASEPTQGSLGDKKPHLAVWYPHPDDDVSPGQARTPSTTPVEMFRRHYDKYLENYEGYVKLAERIYQMRDDAEVPSGSLAEREWEERLRRVNDGIERTTSRLDLLEEYNPELATDDRISRRASIARKSLGAREKQAGP
jgi:hypothetical protein